MGIKIEVECENIERSKKFFDELCGDERLKKLGFRMNYVCDGSKTYFYVLADKPEMELGLRLAKGLIIREMKSQFKKMGLEAEVKEAKWES